MTGDISTDTVLLAFAAAIAVTIANLRVTHTACGELGADYEIIREHADIPLVGRYSCSKDEEEHGEFIGLAPGKSSINISTVTR